MLLIPIDRVRTVSDLERARKPEGEEVAKAAVPKLSLDQQAVSIGFENKSLGRISGSQQISEIDKSCHPKHVLVFNED